MPTTPDTDRITTVQADAPDFRDRNYSPTLRRLSPALNSKPFEDEFQRKLVRDQRTSTACTGFALAALVERMTASPEAVPEISPYMLYFMARRYDDIPGELVDSGSTARGAMQGWQKHGACELKFWSTLVTEPRTAGADWISDGFTRPLGAYYRVDHLSVPDMHAALAETGAIYVTAQAHEGWRNPVDGKIAFTYGQPTIGGHAFLIVGYDEDGFWIQNSWSDRWGLHGYAQLSYGDWRANGMDAWIAQLGVHISSHQPRLGQGLDFKRAGGPENSSQLLSSDRSVRLQQLNPYIIDLGNDGLLSRSGSFHTSPLNIEELVEDYLPRAVADWDLEEEEPIKVGIFAHGGLNKESAAEPRAEYWIRAMYSRKIFPIFVMWETGPMDTLTDLLQDRLRGSNVAGGFWTGARNWLNERIESWVSLPGTAMWDEMKGNALGASRGQGGLRLLCDSLRNSGLRDLLRIHLIGHSAGAIVHSHLLPVLREFEVPVEGVHFMAPACRVELFRTNVLPALQSGDVRVYSQFHLSDTLELADTAGNYGHSLLYLVSNSFEHARGTPILGMEKFFNAANLNSGLPDGTLWRIFEPATARAHGDFPDNEETRGHIFNII